MKTSIELVAFQTYILPTLRKQFTGDALQQHVNDNFSITDGGNPVDIRFTGHHDSGDLSNVIAKAVNAYAKTGMDISTKANRIAGVGNADTSMRISGRTQFFKGADAKEKATRWGMWALAAFAGSAKAASWCQANGLELKSGGQVEGNNVYGGYLVPDLLDSDIQDLRLEYGVFRANARTRVMRSDTLNIPRRTGGLTAYFVGEGAAGTSSKKTWNSIGLTARKVMVIGKFSSELNEDAVVSVGDDLAGEIVYAFSKLEDDCGFIGDATSTYGGITGICPGLININGVDDGGGIVVAAGNLFSEFVLSDFNKTVARLPSYARRGAKWYASPTFVDSVMQKLVTAAGGTRTDDIVEGARPAFLGYPVVRTESLPTADVNSQIACLFGNLQQSSSFGDRRQATIFISPTGVVDGVDVVTTDELLIRGTQRFDIVNHDLGDSTTPGAVVGLMSAAS